MQQQTRRQGRRKGDKPNPIDIHVGSRVRLRRNMLGLSQEKLGEAIRLYWTRFAKNGNPNGEGLPNWAAYDDRARAVFELGRVIGPGPMPTQLEQVEKVMLEVLSEWGERPSSVPVVR